MRDLVERLRDYSNKLSSGMGDTKDIEENLENVSVMARKTFKFMLQNVSAKNQNMMLMLKKLFGEASSRISLTGNSLIHCSVLKVVGFDKKYVSWKCPLSIAATGTAHNASSTGRGWFTSSSLLGSSSCYSVSNGQNRSFLYHGSEEIGGYGDVWW